jgi:hypothetical protein
MLIKLLVPWAIFQSDGNTFSRKDILNKLHNGFDISSFTDTNILLLIISGPTALLAIRVHKQTSQNRLSSPMYEGRVLKQTSHNRLSSHMFEGRVPKQTSHNRLSSHIYEGRVHKQTSQSRLSSPMYEGRVHKQTSHNRLSSHIYEERVPKQTSRWSVYVLFPHT